MAESKQEPEMDTLISGSSSSARSYAATPPFISRSHPFAEEAKTSFDPIVQGKTHDGLHCPVMHDLEDIIQSICIDHSATDERDSDDDESSSMIVPRFLARIGLNFNIHDWLYEEVSRTSLNINNKKLTQLMFPIALVLKSPDTILTMKAPSSLFRQVSKKNCPCTNNKQPKKNSNHADFVP